LQVIFCSHRWYTTVSTEEGMPPKPQIFCRARARAARQPIRLVAPRERRGLLSGSLGGAAS
jgi:hypothetical protein